jgi:two-component system OmpR family sensor kinase
VLTELVALRRAGGLDIELFGNGPLLVRADRDAVAQAVTNLLVNCARHAPGSHVEVNVRQDGEQVVVEVRDDGPGGPPGSEDALVEQGVTGARTGGSGLGLAVSRCLLTAHGGDLRVLPTTGRGFRVRCTLPAGSATRSGGARDRDERVRS